MKNIRLAVAGYSGSGKSTAATKLSHLLDIPLVKTGVIYRKISCLLYGDDSKEHTQKLGDAIDSLDELISLKAAFRICGAPRSYIVDAPRYNSELKYLKAQGCTLVYIQCNRDSCMERLVQRGQLADGRTFLHRTEVEIAPDVFEHIITNDASQIEFDSKIEDFALGIQSTPDDQTGF